jgi:hypothetical protein
LSGGLGALGRVIARFFVDRGHRNLTLMSRQFGITWAPESWVDKLDKSIGLHVQACDISSIDTVV